MCDPRLREYRKRLSLESEVSSLKSQVDSLNRKLGMETRWIDTAGHDHRKQLAEATDLQCRSGYYHTCTDTYYVRAKVFTCRIGELEQMVRNRDKEIQGLKITHKRLESEKQLLLNAKCVPGSPTLPPHSAAPPPSTPSPQAPAAPSPSPPPLKTHS